MHVRSTCVFYAAECNISIDLQWYVLSDRGEELRAVAEWPAAGRQPVSGVRSLQPGDGGESAATGPLYMAMPAMRRALARALGGAGGGLSSTTLDTKWFIAWTAIASSEHAAYTLSKHRR